MATLPALDPLEALGLPRAALPRHIAIIMDGNGRWAQQRGLPRIEGHRRGSESVRTVVTQCARLGIDCLSLYTFSTDNWKRPRAEVEALMALYAHYLADRRPEIMENDIRVVQIGRREGLPAEVVRELDRTEELSANNRGLTLLTAVNYGSRAEIVHAVQSIAGRVADGTLRPEQITEELISETLDTAGLPDPDLVIRTGGEMRLSNFLLWQVSYAEFYSTPALWPDFGIPELHAALLDYARRERRYGDVQPPPARPV
jgi:undecaprenyl diphosphate synthase